MKELVLDASVVLKWFRTDGERHADAAHSVRADFEAGRCLLFAPPLLAIEILNVAGRRWGLAPEALDQIAEALPQTGIELVEPDLRAVARWTAAGLTAYDAAYVAVAEGTGAQLLTDDEEIARAAPDVAVRLKSVSAR